MEGPKSRTLGDLLDEMAGRFPGNEAIVTKDDRYTYARFREEADRVARSLIGMGLKKGDKVGMIVGNSAEFLTIAFGAIKAGAVVVPISTWYRAREAEYALKHCEIRFLFIVDEFLGYSFIDMLREIVPESDKKAPGGGGYDGYPYLEHIVALGKGLKGTHKWEGFFAFGRGVTGKALKEAQAAVLPEDLALILLTSGTTSHPKAVQLINRGLVENTFNLGERMHLGPADRYWCGLPMFYGLFATNILEAVITHGATMVVMERFEPGESLRVIEEEKCTVMVVFYNAFAAMINHPDRSKRDLSSLRTGGTVTTHDNLKGIARSFIPQIINAYGLTESYGFCCMTDACDPLEDRIKSLGKVLPGFEYKIVDLDTGEKLPPGKEGELCLKGPYVTPGYYKDPENNRKAFDQDGFFHTGDRIREDEEGCLYFISREKDMIKSGGINVSPAGVEDFLLTNPKVKVVNAIGFPDKQKDEVVMAVIELKAGMEATQEEIIEYCKGKIAGYSVPKLVYFIKAQEWPLTSSGKVQKNILKELMVSKIGMQN